MKATTAARVIALICVAALTGASCRSAAPVTPATPDRPPAQAKVLLSKSCAVTTEMPPVQEAVPALLLALITAVVPKVVDKAVDAGASYLQRRIDDLSGSSSARGAAELYREGLDGPPTMKLHCLTFVRGEFGAPDPAAVTPDWKKEQLSALGLARPPALYMEFALLYANDRTAVRLQPLLVDYRETVAARTGRANAKDILVTGQFESPMVSEGAAQQVKWGSFQIALTGLKIGSRLQANVLNHLTSQWIPLPQPTQMKAKGADNREVELWGTVPTSVLVTVQESEKAGDLLLKASQIANESKGDVAKGLTKLIQDALKPAAKEGESPAGKTAGKTAGKNGEKTEEQK